MTRGGSGTAEASKMEHFVIIVNGWKPLTIITKSSVLDVAAVLDPPLRLPKFRNHISPVKMVSDYQIFIKKYEVKFYIQMLIINILCSNSLLMDW